MPETETDILERLDCWIAANGAGASSTLVDAKYAITALRQREKEWRALGAETPHAMNVVLDIALDATKTKDATIKELRAELRKIERHIINDHVRALPANWVFTDTETTLDLMAAEITTQRQELTALRSKMEAAEDLADLLKTLNRLGGLGLDKHQWIRESLDRWDEACKASAPSQSVSSLDEARKTTAPLDNGTVKMGDARSAEEAK